MRSYPIEDYEIKESTRLEPEPWMLEQLRLNPSYTCWGPGEDGMYKTHENGGDGWDSSVIYPAWKDFGFGLDDLNEVVHFYFSIARPHEDCPTCAGKGKHPDAQWITESWYRHGSPFTTPDDRERDAQAVMERFGCVFKPSLLGRGTLPPDDVLLRYGKPFLDHCVATIENGGAWSTDLTQDEADALWDGHRLRLEFKERPAASQVNAWAASGRGIGHDAINSWICTERRCERLGVPYSCPQCQGHGHLFTGPASLTLTLWVLHPGKSCSRGVEVQNVREVELPEIYGYLRKAADRNAQRFSAIPAVRAANRAEER